ncbi:MAG TPA: hypothetical protein VF398_11425 [bacterium]|jgi:hypothetical protein
MRFKAVVVFLLILAISIPGLCAGRKGDRFPLTVKVAFSTSYDDNILKYSDQDLNRFETHTEPFPSEITTTDDWVNAFGLRLYRDFDLGRRFRFRPYYAGKISLYAVNQIKNYQSHNFIGRLAYRNRAYFSLKYFYLPSYYLRIYKDKDWNAFRGAQFDLFRPAVSLRVRSPWAEFEAEGGRELTYYSEYFTEYDAEAFFWNVSASRTILENLSLTVGYGLKVSDNIGFDQIGVGSLTDPTVDTEYGDASYEEDQYSLEIAYLLPLPAKWDWKIGLNVQHSERYYQSSLTSLQDPFHVGREDRRTSFEPSLTVSPGLSLDLELRYSYDRRRTDSPVPSVSQVKDFDQHAIEFSVIYQIF